MCFINTPKWIEPKLFESVLREIVKDFQEIKNFEVKPALAPGENFATIMLNVKIEVLLTNGSTQCKSFMLKVALDTEVYHTELYKWELFKTESGMYRYIKPEFENLYRKAGLDVKFGAQAYQLKVEEEYILLEDLSVRGFKNAKRQNCLDMEHCKAVLKKLAQFHAASAVRVEHQGMFDILYQHGFLKENCKSFLKKMCDSTLPHLIKTTQNLENLHQCSQQIAAVADNLTEIIYCHSSVDDKEFNVLNHGDTWMNNIMFQYDKNGKLKETFLVDLQVPRYGSPAQDLLYFIVSSADKTIKVKEFDYMIKYYYDQLIEHLNILNYTKPAPSFGDIHKALIKYGIWAFFALFTVMGTVLCEQTDTANIDNLVGNSEDGDKFKEFVFTNERYMQHLSIVLPWLCYRGAFAYDIHI